jgi:hypothetical protein
MWLPKNPLAPVKKTSSPAPVIRCNSSAISFELPFF